MLLKGKNIFLTGGSRGIGKNAVFELVRHGANVAFTYVSSEEGAKDTVENGKKSTRLKKPEEITNDDIIGIINGLVKSEQTVLDIKRETTSEYLEILKLYLPKMVSREEIVAWINENIDFSQYKNKMQTMGAIMKHFGKTADGKQVNQILQEM